MDAATRRNRAPDGDRIIPPDRARAPERKVRVRADLGFMGFILYHRDLFGIVLQGIDPFIQKGFRSFRLISIGLVLPF